MEITILTAKFVRFETIDDEEKAIVDVRIARDIVQRRAFDKIYVEGIKNLKNLLIGIKTQPGCMEINFINGNRYSKLFGEAGWPDERVYDIDPYGEEIW